MADKKSTEAVEVTEAAEAVDYKQVTVDALNSGAGTLTALRDALPSEEGKEPDCVKNARNWLSAAAQTLQDGVKELGA